MKFLVFVLTIMTIESVHGQVTNQPFSIQDSNKGTIDVDHFVIKAGNKTHEFKGDTSSVDYKSLAHIDPNWIKRIEILKNEQLHGGGTKSVVIITLKKRKVKRLPDDIRNKFQ